MRQRLVWQHKTQHDTHQPHLRWDKTNFKTANAKYRIQNNIKLQYFAWHHLNLIHLFLRRSNNLTQNLEENPCAKCFHYLSSVFYSILSDNSERKLKSCLRIWPGWSVTAWPLRTQVNKVVCKPIWSVVGIIKGCSDVVNRLATLPLKLAIYKTVWAHHVFSFNFMSQPLLGDPNSLIMHFFNIAQKGGGVKKYRRRLLGSAVFLEK